MTSPIEPRTASLYHASRAPAVEPPIAAAIVAAGMASYLVASALAPMELAFVIAQVALVAVVSGAVVMVHPARPLAALGLRGARPVFFGAAIAIGATTWYLNALLADWLIAKLSLPESQVHHLKHLIDRPGLLRALATFALLPAVCEEVVFRGVLARSLGRRTALIAAAAISAVVFSIYHLSPVQALPTLTLGLVLAVLAIRADSVAPAMVAHAINNALAIAVSRDELPGIADWLGNHPAPAAVGCGAVTALGIGIALVAKGPA